MKIEKPKGNERPYVLKRDRGLPVSERTVWKLKYLTADAFMAILDIEVSNGVGSGHMARIREGLAGWDNLQDENGNAVRFAVDEENRVKKDLLDLIVKTPGGVLALYELSRAIHDLSTWTGEQEKNSGSAHSSSPENSVSSTAKDAPASQN